jgi:hypothetical protein
MNVNEECLLKFLNNPGRLESITDELKNINIKINELTKAKRDNKLRTNYKSSPMLHKSNPIV